MQRSTLILLMTLGFFLVLCPPETDARMTLQQLRNAMRGVAKGCINKSGVSKDLVAQTKNGVFAEDKPLQCYFLCLLMQMKIIKDGRLALDVINKQIDMMMPLDILDRSKEVTLYCNDQANSDDACERAWQFSKCYWETDSSIYFLA